MKEGFDIEHLGNNENFRAFGKIRKSKGYFKISPSNFAIFEPCFHTQGIKFVLLHTSVNYGI